MQIASWWWAVALVSPSVAADERVAAAVEPESGGVDSVQSEAAAEVPLDVITVVAGRSEPRTASSLQVSARELSSVPGRTAEDALRLVPGFTLVQHGSEGKGHQFFLRGFDAVHGADLELTVEGLPVNEWSNIHGQGYIDLGFIIPEAIESVRVTKGPFLLDQGAFAMAGSAEYRLGISEPWRGLRSTYTVGMTNRQRGVLTYSPTQGDGHDFVAAEALHDDGFGDNRGIDRAALLGRTRLVDDARHGTLSLLVSGYLARFDLPGTLRAEEVEAGRVGFYGTHDPAGDGLSGRGLLALFHERETANLRLASLLYAGYRRLELLENYTGFLLNPITGDRRKQDQHTWSFGARSTQETDLLPELVLHTGLEVRGDVLDQSQLHVDQNLSALETERQLEALQTALSALAGLRWQPFRSLRLAAGARLDWVQVAVQDGLAEAGSDSGGTTTLLPRATVEWRPLARWQLFAAYGRGFRPPEARAFSSFEPERTGLTEDLYEGGDPRSTVADSFELGARWFPHPYLGGSLSGFATRIERESVFDHVSGLNLELNQTQRLGVELVLRSEPFAWLSLSGDITYVQARFAESNNPIPLAPRLLGGARAVVTHEDGWRAGLRFFGFGRRPLPHGARGAPMAVVDASAGYRWERWQVDLDAENLLGRRIREGEYHYASHWRPGQSPSELPVTHFVPGPPLNLRLNVSAAF